MQVSPPDLYCHNVGLYGHGKTEHEGSVYLARKPLLEALRGGVVGILVLEASPTPKLFALRFFMKNSFCCVSFKTKQLQTITMSSSHCTILYILFNLCNYFMR